MEKNIFIRIRKKVVDAIELILDALEEEVTTKDLETKTDEDQPDISETSD